MTKTIPELMEVLGKARDEMNSAYDDYKIQKIEYDSARNELMEMLAITGLKSAKTEDFTASIVSKPSILITHEQSVIDWIQNNPDVDPEIYIGLKKSSFDPLAKQWFAKTGEVIPGTDTKVDEYLTIKSNKKETKNEE